MPYLSCIKIRAVLIFAQWKCANLSTARNLSCAKRSELQPPGGKKNTFFFRFEHLISQHWIIKNNFFDYFQIQIIKIAKWNVLWKSTVRKCVNINNNVRIICLFKDFQVKKNRWKYFHLSFCFKNFHFFLKKEKINRFFAYFYYVLLREFKVARKYLNQLREFKVREFMYCAKIMVREL